MKKRLLAGAAAAGLLVPLGLGASTTASASTATSSTAWASTGTLAEPTSGLTALGALAPTSTIRLTVALGLRNASTLTHDIAAGDTFTEPEFVADFGPTAASAEAVSSYLTEEGFTGVSVASNRILVTATGTASQAESAFDTTLDSFTLDGKDVYANVTAAKVPAALGGIVSSVLGLDDVGTMTTELHTDTNPASSCTITGVGYPCTYNPQGFWKAYDATSAPTGSATTIAIFAEGDLTQVIKDLRQEEAANGLPEVKVTVVPTGIASSDTSGADEWDLDTQYSTGMADNVKQLIVYDATSLTDSDTAREFNAFAAADAAKAGSASFGECEYQAYLDGSMLADDETFAEAAAQGQTVFASAGDTGGFCPVASNNGVPAGVPDVNYPASSPYVVGVGGTTLITSSTGAYDEELAWVAGGGGPSLFEAAPAWQATDGYIGTVSTTVCGVEAVVNCGRTVPDISMDADPNSGANVYVDGTPEGVGGTSLASPLSLGVWVRLEAAGREKLGFASPLLYKANGTAAFHDITLGDTGPYPALPGYDLATGIGTFDVAGAVSVIK